jgi:hypothetical protein
LAARGVITSYPEYEDWGWFLEYITAAGDEFWLCCGNREGEAEKWLCYLNLNRLWINKHQGRKARRGAMRKAEPPRVVVSIFASAATQHFGLKRS